MRFASEGFVDTIRSALTDKVDLMVPTSLVARCSELEADLTKPEFVSSTGAVVLSCNILVFTSKRLLQTVNDDSILCTFQYQQKADSDEVESVKRWKLLIWMHINAQFFHVQFCQSLSLSAPLRFELGCSCREHLEFRGKRWNERVGVRVEKWLWEAKQMPILNWQENEVNWSNDIISY